MSFELYQTWRHFGLSRLLKRSFEVQPPLLDAHPKLVEAFVNPEDSEDLRPTLEAIKSSEEPDLPYHGGQM